MSADLRWLVETSHGQDRFDDVGAESLEVTQGGALVFRGTDGEPTIAYAPSAWITVVVDQ